MRRKLSLLKRRPFLPWKRKCCYKFLHHSSPNLTGNNLNLVFFGYKVSTQQHFKTRLFWKNAKKLRICSRNTLLVLSSDISIALYNIIYRKPILFNRTQLKTGLYLFLEIFERDCIRDRTLFGSGLYSRVYGIKDSKKPPHMNGP